MAEFVEARQPGYRAVDGSWVQPLDNRLWQPGYPDFGNDDYVTGERRASFPEVVSGGDVVQETHGLLDRTREAAQAVGEWKDGLDPKTVDFSKRSVKRLAKFTVGWALVLATPGYVVNGGNTVLDLTFLANSSEYVYTSNIFQDFKNTAEVSRHSYKVPIAIAKWAAKKV